MERSVGCCSLALATALASSLVSTIGCTRHDIALFEISGVELEYFVVVPLTAQGDPTRVSTVYRAQDRALNGKPLTKLADGERTAAVVALTRAQLLRVHPGFDRDREKEIMIALGAPPDSPQLRVIGETGMVDATLPSDATVLGPAGAEISVDEMRRRIRRQIVLTIPVDPEHCRLGQPGAFTAFGDRPQLLPDSMQIPGERGDISANAYYRKPTRVIAVDADRALMLTPKMLYLVRRGEPIALPPSESALDPSVPSSVIALDQLGRLYPRALALAIDPAHRAPDGSIPVLIGGDEGNRARVWELELSSAGLRFITTATIAWGTRAVGDAVRDLAIDASGTVVGVGEPGSVLIRLLGNRDFAVRPRPDGAAPDAFFRRVIASGIAQKPHLIGSDEGKLYLGDARTSEWTYFKRSDRFNTLRFDGLASAPGEMWAVGHIGTMFRKLGSAEWGRVQLELPPRFIPCSSGAGGERSATLVSHVVEVALDAEHAYLVTDNCTATLRVRRSDLCVSVLTHPDLPISTSNLDYTSASLLDGMLLVAGSGGTLLRLGP